MAERAAQRSLAGGCLCGAIRYRVTGRPVDAGYCHCRLCRRSAGAPAVVWATYAIAAFRFTRGRAKTFRSSPRHLRRFCGRCGTPLVFRKARGATHVDVSVATLDDPDAVRPEYHIWTASRVAWFDVRDRLPRHLDSGPDVLE